MLFQKQIARKPDLYPWAQVAIREIWKGFWTPEKFNFISDLHQFKTEMTEQEREVVVKAISCVAQIEVAVKTFWGKLHEHFGHPSISDLGFSLANTEVIHGLSYAKLLDVLGLEGVFEENLKLEVIQGRVGYLRKYLEKNYDDDKQQYIYSLILFTIFVENVSLFSQFYIILWFNKYKKVLKDTSNQIEYTRNEETIHYLVGCKLINTLREEYPKLFDHTFDVKVKRASKEAFKAEEKIIDWILGDFECENLSKPIVKEYIKNRINDSLKNIGFDEAFEIDKELLVKTQWMEEAVYGNNFSDFFHKKPVDYTEHSQDFSVEAIFQDS